MIVQIYLSPNTDPNTDPNIDPNTDPFFLLRIQIFKI